MRALVERFIEAEKAIRNWGVFHGRNRGGDAFLGGCVPVATVFLPRRPSVPHSAMLSAHSSHCRNRGYWSMVRARERTKPK